MKTSLVGSMLLKLAAFTAETAPDIFEPISPGFGQLRMKDGIASLHTEANLLAQQEVTQNDRRLGKLLARLILIAGNDPTRNHVSFFQVVGDLTLIRLYLPARKCVLPVAYTEGV